MGSLFVDLRLLQHLLLIILIMIKGVQGHIIDQLSFSLSGVHLSHYFLPLFFLLQLIVLANVVQLHIFVYVLVGLGRSIGSLVIVRPVGMKIYFIVIHMEFLGNLCFYCISALPFGRLDIEGGGLGQ